MITAVRFHADWCTPCKQYEPVFKDWTSQNPHILVTDVDIDKAPLTKDAFNIMTVPTTVGLLNGVVVVRLTGVQTKQQLEDAFAPYL